MLALIAHICAGQVSQAHHVLIRLPAGVASETVFIRYVLAGQKFGGWVQSAAGVSSYEIGTMAGDVPATGLKAVVYAPGCALQTIDMSLSASKDDEYSFLCRPLPKIRMNGRLIQSGPLYRHGVDLQARYIARWAHGFLGLRDDSVLTIPVGDRAEMSSDGRFGISIPDLFSDPLAGASSQRGELQIVAKDRASKELLALLIPAGNVATQAGGLRIEREYPAEVVFAACAVNRSILRDESGFARRSDVDGCDRQNPRR
jgi:hypothetical protein